MADEYDLAVTALRIACDAIGKLKADELRLLVEGKGSFAFVPLGASVTASGPDVHDIRARLDALQSRREAVAYVDGLKLKKPALVTLARQLDIAVTGKETVAEVKRRIIEGTVGTRADVAAIRGGSW
jgi:hypothetical protein